MISKRKKLYFFSVVILVIGVTAFIVYRHNASKSVILPEGSMVLSPRTKESLVQIMGLEFSGYNEGKKVISIKADKFTVEKKKIGFLTTSLFNVANLKNTVIDIYGQGNISEKGTVTGLREQLSDVTFKETFSKNAFSAFPVKTVASITTQPVSVNLYIENSPVTRISASSAGISMKQRDMVFQGEVKVISGERTLMTDRMAFSPEKAIITTDRHYVLKTIDGQSEGEKLSADIFLMPVNGRNEPKETKRAKQ